MTRSGLFSLLSSNRYAWCEYIILLQRELTHRVARFFRYRVFLPVAFFWVFNLNPPQLSSLIFVSIISFVFAQTSNPFEEKNLLLYTIPILQ